MHRELLKGPVHLYYGRPEVSDMGGQCQETTNSECNPSTAMN